MVNSMWFLKLVSYKALALKMAARRLIQEALTSKWLGFSKNNGLLVAIGDQDGEH